MMQVKLLKSLAATIKMILILVLILKNLIRLKNRISLFKYMKYNFGLKTQVQLFVHFIKKIGLKNFNNNNIETLNIKLLIFE